MEFLLFGFLFTLGGMFAFAFFILLLFIFARSRKKSVKADGKAWREYLNEIIKDNEFAEAAILTKLLADKKDSDIIDTPAGYKVHVDKSIVIDENAAEEGISKIKVHKTFKITKVKTEGDVKI